MPMKTLTRIHLRPLVLLGALLALASAEAALPVSKSEFETISEANSLLTVQGDTATAVAVLQELLATPGLSEGGRQNALNMLAFAQYQQGDIQGALSTYKRLLWSDELPEETRLQTLYSAAQLYMLEEEFGNSLDYLNKYLGISTSPPAGVFILKAQLHFRLDEFGEMPEPINRAVEITRNGGLEPKEDWFRLLALALFEIEDAAGLEQTYDEMISEWPSEEHVEQAVVLFLDLRDAARLERALRRLQDRFPANDKSSPVQIAIAGSDIEALTQLASDGVSLETQDAFKRTPLQLAAELGDVEVVDFLIANGVDVNQVNTNGDTAVLFAATSGYDNIVRRLWQAGADVRLSHQKYTPFQLMAQAGKRQLFDELIAAYPDIIETDGELALFLAVVGNQTEIAQFLVTNGAPPSHRSDSGMTPMHWAVGNDNTRLVEQLLDNGAEADGTNDKGQSPLMLAVQRQEIGIAATLLTYGANPNRQYSNGLSMLAVAARDGDADLMQELLEAGANVAGGAVKGNPLRWAAGGGHLDAVRVLLAAGAEVQEATEDRDDILLIAALAESPEVMQALLDAGAPVRNSLERLARWNSKDVTGFLKENDFRRQKRGDVETWAHRDDDSRVVLVPKQKENFGVVAVVDFARQSGIEASDWIVANR